MLQPLTFTYRPFRIAPYPHENAPSLYSLEKIHSGSFIYFTDFGEPFKKMRNTLFIPAILIINGCFPDMIPPKSIIKTLKSGNIEIEWSSGSAAYVDVPDLIVMTNGNISDTICRASNIADLSIRNSDTILVGFYGKPTKLLQDITLPQKMMSFTIVVDTTYEVKNKTPP